MKKYMSYLLLFVFLSAAAGCTARIGAFTVLSTKNVELGAKYEKVGSAEARDEIIVFFIPLGEPDIEKAINKLLDDNKGDLLTNTILSSFNYSFLFGVMGYSVKADVWRKVTLLNYNPSKEYFELSKAGKDLYLISDSDSSIKYRAFTRN